MSLQNTSRKRQPLIDDSKLTVERIRAAIPPHLLKQNTLKSFEYLLLDIAQILAWGYLWLHYGFPFVNRVYDVAGYYPGLFVSFVAWNTYWFIQGLSFGGLWVLAHECGHGGFSSIPTVNTVVGWVVHSALLVPYQSWKITHATHHRQCNNCEKDTVFLPSTQPSALKEALNDSPIVSVLQIIVMLTLGWPFHLLFNVAGQPFDGNNKRRINHFEPSSPLFRKEEQPEVIMADLGVLLAIAGLWYASTVVGFSNVFFWYIVPYLWTNHWLVVVTYLQHTDLSVPHYDQKNHSFVRGALATVDRDFGPFINWKLHHIQDSHVAHHLFSNMPFYHAKEATEYLKPVLGEHYIADTTTTNYLRMIWASWRTCRYVVPSEGISYFRN